MPTVVGVRFKDSGKTYYFDPNGLTPLNQGDQVIVETVRGPELAKIAYIPHTVPESEIVGELKSVLRYAESYDLERLKSLNARQNELLARCTEKVLEHNLPMRLVKAEYSFDGSRLTFYFTSEKRVDFRLLVRDLARLFRARIELRQIGPRDEAKLLGGIGPCGRILCCATFLPDYARVSIKMAKDQDLPLNPVKISGVCGRLLCCLAYEHEQYLEIKAELPKKGSWVQTPDGPGEVIAVNVVRETVMVELAGSMTHEEFAPGQLSAATEQVAQIARSRNEEGITPAALLAEQSAEPNGNGHRRDKKQPYEPPARKDRGERRLLRDEIDNPEVLDALAMLEEFHDEPTSTPAPGPVAPAAQPANQRRPGTPNPVRRPIQAQRRAQNPAPQTHQQQPQRPAPDDAQAANQPREQQNQHKPHGSQQPNQGGQNNQHNRRRRRKG
jgi:cell fate regulator YaaT (PSP1 superfamily)